MSPNTIDTHSQPLAARLRVAAGRPRRPPSELAVEHIDAPLILAFLEYRLPAALEQIRLACM